MDKIALLPGDGIGPEIIAATKKVLQHLDDFDFSEGLLIGSVSLDASGVALTPEVLEECQLADAVLMGAVGGAQSRRNLEPAEAGIDRIRQGLNIYANLRPIKPYPALLNSSPLKPEVIEGTDILLVRELSAGIYFGEKTEGIEQASDLCSYTKDQVLRIARLAFELASSREGQTKVTSIDKANVMATSRLWRQTVEELSFDYPDVRLESLLVDNAATQLISRPRDFDVLLTENLFGDILSDELAVIVSSLGMVPSAGLSLGGPGLFESAHGSAPDIAGQGIVNPIATFLAAALMLRYGLGREAEAIAIETAVEVALEAHRTPDLIRLTKDPKISEVGTEGMTDAVISFLS